MNGEELLKLLRETARRKRLEKHDNVFSVILVLREDWEKIADYLEKSSGNPQRHPFGLGESINCLGVRVEIFNTQEELDIRRCELAMRQVLEKYQPRLRFLDEEISGKSLDVTWE